MSKSVKSFETSKYIVCFYCLHKCDVIFEILLKLYQKTKKTMGVRGLKSFLEREKQCRTVNIGVEINKWKR